MRVFGAVGRRSLMAGVAFVAGGLGAVVPAVAQDQAAATGEDDEIPAIVVERTGPAGPDKGYVAARTATGSKTDTPVERIPQSVSIVTRKQIEDRQPRSIEDVVAYTAGVTPSPWGVDQRFDQFFIRGFELTTTGIFRDGLTQRVQDFSGFKIEPYSLERVEVLKGPSSVLYGMNEAGGMVNAITKRPTTERFYEANLSYGSFDTVEASFDVGGAIDAAEEWSYRLTGLYRDGSTQVDNTENDRLFIAPAVTWQPDENTSITVLANIQSDELSPNYFLPVAGVDYDASLGKLPRSFTTGQENFDKFDVVHGSIGYLFEHSFNESFTVRQNVRFMQQDTDYAHLYYAGYMASADTMGRYAFTVDEIASLFATDTQGEWKAEYGRFQSTLLFGLDASRQWYDGTKTFAFGPQLDLSITDPDYSQTVDGFFTLQDGSQSTTQVGLYVQEQLTFDDHWILTLGGRHDWVSDELENDLSGTTSSRNDNAFSGRVGLGYAFDNGITPYVSASSSFLPVLGQSNGQAFDPSEATQYELGVKYKPEGFDGLFTVAMFDLTKTNVVQTDANFVQKQVGEINVRGLELEAQAEVWNGLSVLAAYTYLDAEITEDANTANIGNRPQQVPEHQASLWANYAFREGPFEGLSFGAGVRFVGDNFGDNANTLDVDATTLFDAALRYEKKGVRGAINVSNLFDKEYYATCSTGAGCIYGEGRVIKGSLSLRF